MTVTGLATVQEREEGRRWATRALLYRDVVLRRATALGLVWLAAYAGATWLTAGSPAARQALGELVYLVPIAVAAVLSVWVACKGSEPRWFWRLLAASNVLWLGGDLTWATYSYVLHEQAPFPSVADAVYLGSYALVPVAVIVGFHAAGRLSSLRGLLDAAIVASALGFTGWELLIQPQLTGALDAATLTGIAYPMLGVVIIVTLLAVGSSHRSVPLPMMGIAAAFAVSAVTDAGYTWATVLHAYLPGSWLNVGWQVEAVLMSLALLVALRHDEGAPSERERGRDFALVPVVASVAVVMVLLLWDVHDGVVAPNSVVSALIVLVIVVMRFAVSLLDLHRTTTRLDDALREQERLAVTDGLTGLYNRRFITELLTIEVDRALRGQRPLSVIAIDIDHFKRINDTHGHPVGDAVLGEVGRRLSGALRGSDVLARTGGEEFLVLAHDTDAVEVLDVAERIRQAVGTSDVVLNPTSAHPKLPGVRVTVSIGLATLEEGDSYDSLSRRADRALYAAKEGGRDRVMTTDEIKGSVGLAVDPAALAVLELVADIVDRRLSPDEHSTSVAVWSSQVAGALGLPPRTRAEIGMAGRLHDIGKIDIPDSILQKRAPLAESEWALLQAHPVTGADMMRGLVPPGVAAIVASHHERYDGAGYPHGLPAQDIPVGARVIAVTDAYAAMTARRHYAPRQTHDEADAELVRCSGTQFDPAVVAAFRALLAEGVVTPAGPLPQQRQGVELRQPSPVGSGS
ncbi:MAG TPA: diguanylate cyclase [Nocardioidaceae bacterium]|nr:diguanylate cyclase [Nocardioidaceae bacterium]